MSWASLGGLGLAVLIASNTSAEARVRFVAMANDEGLATDAPLRFAETDAEAVLAAFREVAAESTLESELILDATAPRVLEKLQAWQREAQLEDTLVLFLSSHGDGRGAHLGDTLLPWPVLERRLRELPARRMIALIDTCQSGALLGDKGFVRGPPLTLSVRRPDLEGRVLITSSGAREASHESALLGGSPFAHHLSSGLRGLADRDGDGKVTLFELYRHVFERTVASTLDSPLGPQRPRQRASLAGAGELVIAEPSKVKGRVVGSNHRDGPCWILDAGEQRVLAELEGPESLALAPGRYVVKCRQHDRQLAVAGFTLERVTHLDDLSFASSPARFTLLKGSSSRGLVALEAAGGVVFGSERRLEPGAMLGLFLSVPGSASWRVQAILLREGEESSGILTAGAGFHPAWWPAGKLTLGIGVGSVLTKEGAGVALQQFARVDLPLLNAAQIVLGAQTLTLFLPARDSPVALRFLLTLGFGFPIEPGSGIEEAPSLPRDERKD